MHIRARLHRRRIQISLVDTRRVQGKVRQEHVASLGSVPPDMTPADRLAFWTQVHPRLARLDNRLDQAALAKVMGELHAKVPMVAIGDPGLTAGKIEIAEHNAGLWTKVREHTLATVEDQRALVAKLTTKIAESEKLAADAAGFAAADRDKVERLKAGEDVDIGKKVDFRAELLKAGFTEADLRHAKRLNAVIEAGLTTIEELSSFEVDSGDQRGRDFVDKLYRRHIRSVRSTG
jgi:hypothetical protein